MPCPLSDPATCGGPCPNATDVCTVDSAGGPSFCAPPPVPCELSDPDTCDGLCPDPNDVCRPQTIPILPSPELPPESQTPGTPDCDQVVSQYEGQDVHALFPGGVDFSDPQHKCFRNVTRQRRRERQRDRDRRHHGRCPGRSGRRQRSSGRDAVTGPMTVVTYGKTGNTTGTFADRDRGPVPHGQCRRAFSVEIREKARARQSTG